MFRLERPRRADDTFSPHALGKKRAPAEAGSRSGYASRIGTFSLSFHQRHTPGLDVYSGLHPVEIDSGRDHPARSIPPIPGYFVTADRTVGIDQGRHQAAGSIVDPQLDMASVRQVE